MADVADLALILFLPWFFILGALYWFYPRTLEKTPARRRFDLGMLAAAFIAAFIAGRWGYAFADTSIEAEAARLVALGASEVARPNQGRWIVLQAPTGHRFCVVRAREPLTAANATFHP